MNRTRIDWATHSWNPVTGCLGPKNDGATCAYCYARRIAERFRGSPAFPNGFAPTFHEERLHDPDLQRIPAGSRVFVGSMTDLGAPWAYGLMPYVLEAVRGRPDVTFIFLTKQPKGFVPFVWPDNCWVGATYTGIGSAEYIRLKWGVKATVRFVSMEPLLGDELLAFTESDGENTRAWANWIIVGAQTGPGATAPKREWIQVLDQLTRRWRIPLFMKANLRPHWGGAWRQEYPR